MSSQDQFQTPDGIRARPTNQPRSSAILEAHIYRSYDDTVHAEGWRNLPEIPTSDEIMPKALEPKVNLSEYPYDWNEYQFETPVDPNLPKNIVDGQWESREAYLGAHYQILRKDAVLSLQRSVESFQRKPLMLDDRNTCLYTQITFKGITCTRSGIAFRIEFSVERSPKRIRWEQSKRLSAGSIVALSPERDGFKNICKVGIIAARPFEGGLDQNPPQVDIFFGDVEDIAFDPLEKYVMIEARQGYFEASRHMLVAIQKLMTERFQLENHLVALEKTIEPPPYLENHPYMDLSCVIDPDYRQDGLLENVNVLDGIEIPHCNMDSSQQKACERMLTKRLAVVQGPPGTGKTHVSVTAVKALIASSGPDDPPIIVAAQTNHALDQLLNHILAFEKNIVRLGARCSKNNTEIISRTLYELRLSIQGMKGAPRLGATIGAIKREYESRVNSIKGTLLPLTSGNTLTGQLLFENGIISQEQFDSLNEEGWDSGTGNDLETWLHDLVPIPQTPCVNFGLEMEEDDEEDFDGMPIIGLESPEGAESQEAKDNEGLIGEYIAFNRRHTGRASIIPPSGMRKLLAKKDLYRIPLQYRGEVYRRWEKQLNEKMLQELKGHMREYSAIVNRQRLAKELSHVQLINFLNIKLIGCTTTGLAKYRGVLSALQPRILMIEEAAETIEGTIIAGQFDSLQHMILVGDHHQLQANCSVAELGLPPYNLNVSMFERLVRNGIEFNMLNRQRRMNPEIRQLLTIDSPGNPFYTHLYDHDSVYGRAPIPGMGKLTTWWCSHNFPEFQNTDGSYLNVDEAEMIANFYAYLVLNGNDPAAITVLTFYNGQRKELMKQLRRVPTLQGHSRFKVHTVDSYQGEEAEIILLSLVRSNTRMSIGFLANRNRVIVALSRARRGMYLFGSSYTLRIGESIGDDHPDFVREPLWAPIIEQMAKQGRFVLDRGLPITCKNHGKVTYVHDPGDWIGNAGGCHEKCREVLPCGHKCPYKCHAIGHSEIVCPAPCTKEVPICGHNCSRTCGESCYCELCKSAGPLHETENAFQSSDIRFEENSTSLRSTIAHWKTFDPVLSDQLAQQSAVARIAALPVTEPVFLETWQQTGLDERGHRVQISKQVILPPSANPSEADRLDLETHASVGANIKVAASNEPLKMAVTEFGEHDDVLKSQVRQRTMQSKCNENDGSTVFLKSRPQVVAASASRGRRSSLSEGQPSMTLDQLITSNGSLRQPTSSKSQLPKAIVEHAAQRTQKSATQLLVENMRVLAVDAQSSSAASFPYRPPSVAGSSVASPGLLSTSEDSANLLDMHVDEQPSKAKPSGDLGDLISFD